MKVCVYAICKNESQFARRWVSSMSEADHIYVLDTGSDDGTPELLSSLGAEVEIAVISPWRFDVARNRSLTLVPGGRGYLRLHRPRRVLSPRLEENCWRRPGWRGRSRRHTATPGTSTQTARRAMCSGRRKYTPGTAGSGHIPCMRCRVAGRGPAAEGVCGGDAAGPPGGQHKIARPVSAAAGAVRPRGPG